MSSKIFIRYLNTLKMEYGRFVLFYDGVPWHTLGTVKKFLEKNRKTIMPVRFPRCSPELNPEEECRRVENGGIPEILGIRLYKPEGKTDGESEELIKNSEID